jgi:hypothetical protein
MLVVMRQWETNAWAGEHCEAASWVWGMKIGKKKDNGVLIIPPFPRNYYQFLYCNFILHPDLKT